MIRTQRPNLDVAEGECGDGGTVRHLRGMIVPVGETVGIDAQKIGREGSAVCLFVTG